jgi:hypothetical protein
MRQRQPLMSNRIYLLGRHHARIGKPAILKQAFYIKGYSFEYEFGERK